MSLEAFVTTLDHLESDARAAFAGAGDADTLEAERVRFLGAKKGAVKNAAKQMGSIDPSDRKAAGMRLNECKANVQTAFDETKTRLLGDASDSFDPTFDPTLPGDPPEIGHIHPITQTINHLTEIMGRMGFEAAEGPEVEDPYHKLCRAQYPRRPSRARSTRQLLPCDRCFLCLRI